MEVSSVTSSPELIRLGYLSAHHTGSSPLIDTTHNILYPYTLYISSGNNHRRPNGYLFQTCDHNFQLAAYTNYPSSDDNVRANQFCLPLYHPSIKQSKNGISKNSIHFKYHNQNIGCILYTSFIAIRSYL